jgi:hypothetical protein
VPHITRSAPSRHALWVIILPVAHEIRGTLRVIWAEFFFKKNQIFGLTRSGLSKEEEPPGLTS